MARSVIANGKPSGIMQTQLVNRWFKLVTAAYFCLLAVSFFVLSAPPGKLAIYITMAVLAVGGFFFGKSFFKVLAILLLAFALYLAFVEYKRGQELHQKLQEIHNQAK